MDPAAINIHHRAQNSLCSLAVNVGSVASPQSLVADENRPRPCIASKSLSDTNPHQLTDADKADVTCHSLPTITRYASSSNSTSSITSISLAEAVSADQYALELANDWPVFSKPAAKKFLDALSMFQNDPSPDLAHIADASQAIKHLMPTIQNLLKNAAVENSARNDWQQQTVTVLVNFLTRIGANIDNGLGFHSLKMPAAAKICYALKSYISLEQRHKFFGADHWVSLLTAIRKITREMINQIDRQLLLSHPDTQSGDIVALINLIRAGLEFSPPGRNQTLFSGAKPGNGITPEQIAEHAVSCLLQMKPKHFDTRRLGKLMLDISRLRADGSTAFDDEKLTQALTSWSCSTLLKTYTSSTHPGAQNYVDPVVVDNFTEALVTFSKCGILHLDNNDHVKLVNSVANFIVKAANQAHPLPQSRTLQQYWRFHDHFIGCLPKERCGTVVVVGKALRLLENVVEQRVQAT